MENDFLTATTSSSRSTASTRLTVRPVTHSGVVSQQSSIPGPVSQPVVSTTTPKGDAARVSSVLTPPSQSITNTLGPIHSSHHHPSLPIHIHSSDTMQDHPQHSQEFVSSDSDSEDHQMTGDAERLQFLAASGLVQRPITKQQEKLPPLPPASNPSSPSISFHPSISTESHGRTQLLLAQTPTPRQTPSTSRVRELDLDNDDPLSKMEAAFARYLKIQRDLPSPTELSIPSPRQTIRSRYKSQSLSGHWPSSEHLKSPPLTAQNWIPRHRSSSSGSSLQSSSHGFRSWLSGMSKSVTTATSHSISSNTWLPDRRQSSNNPIGSPSPQPSDRSRPSVSGPIHTVEQYPQPRRPSTVGSPSFIPSSQANRNLETQTWSSIMDPNLLSLYSEKAKNRQEAIYELIKTEAAFVENCQILSQVFYQELQPVIGQRAVTIVFANIDDIMLFGTTFLSALERRQLESGSHIDTVGDIVLDYMQGVHVFRPYCSNQANASRMLSDLKQRPSVANRLNGLKVKGLELEHYLLQPMQRLTRYPLLIGQIMKYTEEGSSDSHRLANALKKVHEVLTATNEAIRKQEDEVALVTLSDQLMIPGRDVKLRLATMTRFNGPRRLIREGVLSKARSRKTFRAHLFNDFFLLARPVVASGLLDNNQSRRNPGPMVMYRAPMALEECQLMPGRDEQTFIVIHHSENFCLKVPDGPRACAAWFADFKAARQEVFKALASHKSKRGSCIAPF